MMGLHATLRRSGGLDALSRRLNLPPADVASAAGRLLPPLLLRYRRLFEQAGAGLAGVRALSGLVAPFGGSDLAVRILASSTIPAEAADGLLSSVLARGESVGTLLGEADPTLADADRLASVLPLLNLLVGGYLTARAEAASAGNDDIGTEFSRLLGGETSEE